MSTATAAGAGTPAAPSVPKAGNAPKLAAQLSAEALGTFLLCFAGLGTALWAGGSAAGTLPVGMGFGLALLAGLVAFGYVSGGHFNPAVSLAAAVAGRIGWLKALYYVLAQVVAAIFAGLVLFLALRLFPGLTAAGAKQTPQTLMSSLANGFDDHSPSGLPMAGVLLIEVVATAIFAAVILGASRPKANTVLAPLAIAATLAAVITVALPLSNASINPARSTAVVFFAEPWAVGQLWLFWVAPLLGAALAGLLYRAFAAQEDGIEAQAEVAVDGSASALAAPPLAVAQDAVADSVPGDDGDDGGNAAAATVPVDGGRETAAAPASGSRETAPAAPAEGTAAGGQEQAPGVSDAQDFFDNPTKP